MQDKASWEKAVLQSKFGLTNKRLELVLQHYTSLDEGIDDKFLLLGSFKDKWLQALDFGVIQEKSKELAIACEAENISYLSIDQKDYPKSLLALYNPPVGIFYKGNLAALDNRYKITVVGSRSVGNLAEIMLNTILRPALSPDITIVSGLAYGIDTLAHKLSVQAGHQAIAIIGSGLDQESFYPKQNLPLSEQILSDGGLIISEYGPQVKPSKFTFPARNRLLAAISNFTLVVQASLKSGTLITAAAARDMGKTVATFPVSPFETSFAGNLQLIKDGANLLTESQDIIDILGINQMLHNQEVTKTFGSELEAKVYKELDLNPVSIDDLQLQLNMDLTSLQMHLTMLEMSGYVRSAGGNQWLIIR
jgi:DNA processing protein